MLAELESPLPLDGVNMAAAALDGGPLPADTPVGYAGYGAEHHGGLMRPDMHDRALRTLPDERCAALEQYDPLDMLCAEGRTETRDSACNGDSGSGLVTDDGGPRRVIGVASWVENDAHSCSPGAIVVFSRVSAVRPWIKQITGV
ncbi:hypothetical protein MSG28_008171 [Choristoneura fumiferana]|uniref:Uncharacterized protein n=2 Tax=Choristoneura fumiferana TaxID=7141 RepID=A0ACC0JA87_CHOFU|nr:hypothetical protein MSG28_008171 [Choristoneura fumiferana]